MIRVQRNIHGATSPFNKPDHATEFHRTRNRRNVYKCNGQVEQFNHSNHEAMRQKANFHQKIRFSPNPNKSSNNNHNVINRTSPLKEIQSVSKSSEGSDHSDSETLFAGSKSYVTPSPSELPKPPKNWMNEGTALLKSIQKQEVLTKCQDVDMDLKEDSAILVVGSKSEPNSSKPLNLKTRKRIK